MRSTLEIRRCRNINPITGKQPTVIYDRLADIPCLKLGDNLDLRPWGKVNPNRKIDLVPHSGCIFLNRGTVCPIRKTDN